MHFRRSAVQVCRTPFDCCLKRRQTAFTQQKSPVSVRSRANFLCAVGHLGLYGVQKECVTPKQGKNMNYFGYLRGKHNKIKLFKTKTVNNVRLCLVGYCLRTPFERWKPNNYAYSLREGRNLGCNHSVDAPRLQLKSTRRNETDFYCTALTTLFELRSKAGKQSVNNLRLYITLKSVFI